MTDLQVVSLFSGIGGIDRGLELAGAKTVLQCEYDKHARAILTRHFPDATSSNGSDAGWSLSMLTSHPGRSRDD
jgi:site-specific DNA-cytosine methylase